MTATTGHNAPPTRRDWRWAVANANVHSSLKLFIHTVELVLDKHGAGRISDKRLSELSSLSLNTVRKWRKVAADMGLMVYRSGDGKGHATEYEMRVPERIAEVADEIASVQKVTNGKVSNERKGTQPKVTFEHKGTQPKGTNECKGTQQMDTFEGERCPTIGYPFKKNNPPPCSPPPDGGNSNGDGVVVNCEKLEVCIGDSTTQIAFSAIDMEATLQGMSTDRARKIAEREAWLWVQDSWLPNKPQRWIAKKIRDDKIAGEVDEIRVADAKAKALPQEQQKPPNMPDHVWAKLNEPST